MASLYEKNNNIWISYYVDGKRKRETLAPLKWDNPEHIKEAEQILKDKEAEIRLGLHKKITPSKIIYPTINEAYKLYLKDNKLKESSKESYQIAVDWFSDFLGNKTTIDKAVSKTFKEFVIYLSSQNQKIHKDKKLSENTIFTYVRPIRTIFQYLADEEIIEANPVPSNRVLKIKSTAKDSPEIPTDEMDLIEDYLMKHDIEKYRYVRFLRLTALRKEDARKMTWNKIFWKQGYILHTIEKTGENQRLPLYDELKSFLESFKKSTGRMFPKWNSRESLKFWNRIIVKINEDIAAGKVKGFSEKLHPYTLHDIRKTTLTELVYKGFDFETIHIFSGHSDPKVTWKHYIKIRNVMKAMERAKGLKFRKASA